MGEWSALSPPGAPQVLKYLSPSSAAGLCCVERWVMEVIKLSVQL